VGNHVIACAARAVKTSTTMDTERLEVWHATEEHVGEVV